MRKIVQIATVSIPNNMSTQCYGYLYALCDDGTLWIQNISPYPAKWHQEKTIPLEAPDA